ncbi:MAG TPA: response regulator transcription factor [Chryseosolibacter sp.]|nr:response regulator transcription factor [Chryseosolibacter sp.]
MKSKRILIADDHAAIRAGVRHILKAEFPDMVFGEATHAGEVLAQINAQKWDALILDINMPGRNGIDILRELKDQERDIPVLVFSMHQEDQIGVRSLKAGAAGFLTKAAADTELVKAIRLLLSGKKYVTPTMAELLITQLSNPDDIPLHELLSNREYETFLLLAAGKSVSQIASTLSLGVPTISTYRARILEKMQLKSNAELTQYAISNKLI